MRVDVPIHRGRPLKLGTHAGIVKSAGLTVEGFIALL
jgi:hypothetical protein